MSQVETHFNCQNCYKPSDIYCITCKDKHNVSGHWCSSCSKTFHSQKSFSDHQPKKSRSVNRNICHLHNLPFSFYCRIHHSLKCKKCFAQSCFNHTKYLKSLETVVEEDFNEDSVRNLDENHLQEKIQEKKQTILELIKARTQISKSSNGVFEKLDEKRIMLHLLVDEMFDQNEQYVKKVNSDKQQILDKQIFEEKAMLKGFESYYDLFESLNEIRKTGELPVLISKTIEIQRIYRWMTKTFEGPRVSLNFNKEIDLEEQIKSLKKIAFKGQFKTSNTKMSISDERIELGKVITLGVQLFNESNERVVLNSLPHIAVHIIDPDLQHFTISNFDLNENQFENENEKENEKESKTNQCPYVSRFRPKKNGVYAIVSMRIEGETVNIFNQKITVVTNQKKVLTTKKAITTEMIKLLLLKNKNEIEEIISHDSLLIERSEFYLRLSNDNKTLSQNNSIRYSTAIGETIYIENRHLIEVRIDKIDFVQKGIPIAIGLVDPKNHKRPAHRNEKGFMFYVYNTIGGTYTYIRNSHVWHKYGKVFRAGDVVGIHLNMGQNNVEFSINGEKLGIAFKNLPLQLRLAIDLHGSENIVTLL
ncbi:spry domain-containing socs box protein [Anaeramoeba flamelloides]|uniref:Spry domain-containing socs box protein n=1 Tax=Anaeramoeba flamelloides TaxID=1746091 RepID=A0ABQ8XNS5_9EUKA|nr:spry domain-containing socs box protein [Anaeramoeba flamelloides]